MRVGKSVRLWAGLGVLAACCSQSRAASNCDLNLDGAVNVIDVQLITNMVLGTAACSAVMFGSGVCNDTERTLVINSALGGACHSVSLSWAASSNAIGYNVYRSSVSGGPYTKINTVLVTGTAYYDINVQPGQTYYYIATSLDSANNESANSSQVSATVPTP